MNKSEALRVDADQSFSAKVIRDGFSNLGAKLGLVWIVIMSISTKTNIFFLPI